MKVENLSSDEEFRRGLAEFNEREFFACHETLEDVWKRDISSERELIQGIIQVAVGYYHYLRKNRVGALKLLKRGLWRLKKFQTSCEYLNIEALADEVSLNIEEIEQTYNEEWAPIKLPTILVLVD